MLRVSVACPRWPPVPARHAHVALLHALLALLWTAQGAIPLNRPVTIQQNGWCFDHQWSSDPDRLILYLCSGGQNQHFVWHQEDSWGFAHLVSVQDDRCVGIDDIDLDADGIPAEQAPISFKKCSTTDKLIEWRYRHGEQQIESVKFPGSCMDFSDTHDFFILYQCKDDIGHDEAKNQRVRFVDDVASPIHAGVPVQIQHFKGGLFDMWSGSCLDQSLDTGAKDPLTLYKCQQGAPNQLFVWTSSSALRSSNDSLPLLTSSLDGRCVAAAKAEVGAGLLLRPCGEGDETLARWRYSHGVQQLQLKDFPYLCFGALREGSPEVGVVGCALDPEPHFEVLSSGRKPVLEHVPLEVKQGDWCLEHKFDEKPEKLVLKKCTELANQEFVWRSGANGSHHLVSNFNDRCLGIRDEDTDKHTHEPREHSPIAFQTCNWSDKLQQLVYALGPEQLRLHVWPHLCMQFDENEGLFTVARCTIEGRGFFGGGGRDVQILRFAEESRAEAIAPGLPATIRVGQFWHRNCLERAAAGDSVITVECDKDGVIDQQFDWLGRADWHFNMVRSLVDDKCLAARRHEVGAPVSLGSCNYTNLHVRWLYSHARGFLKLAEWPELCVDLPALTAAVGSHSSGTAVLANCSYDKERDSENHELAVVDEECEFRTQGLQSIKEDEPLSIQQNGFCLDQPFDESHVTLFGCNMQNNQKFVWVGAPSALDDYHLLISHIDNRCIGVGDGDADDKGKPYRNAPIVFKECSDRDLLIRWVYSYGRKQLQMAEWLYLCMEYDDAKRIFAVQSCAIPDGSRGGRWLERKQALTFEGVAPDAGAAAQRRHGASRRRSAAKAAGGGGDAADEMEEAYSDGFVEGPAAVAVHRGVPVALLPSALSALALAGFVLVALRRQGWGRAAGYSSSAREDEGETLEGFLAA